MRGTGPGPVAVMVALSLADGWLAGGTPAGPSSPGKRGRGQQGLSLRGAGRMCRPGPLIHIYYPCRRLGPGGEGARRLAVRRGPVRHDRTPDATGLALMRGRVARV